MSPFASPSGGVRPGLRPPEEAQYGFGHSPGYSPWSGFSPRDLDACYPMPAWVAERIRLYPQASQGNALHDPLPVPFTNGEVRDALQEVWLAAHQRNHRRCADVNPASVRIAMQLLPILVGRNGGWIDFSGRVTDPVVNTPGSRLGRGANLRCVLAELAGKPLPPWFGCSASGPGPNRTYNVNAVRTTYSGRVQPSSEAQLDPSLFPTAHARDRHRTEMTGAEIELHEHVQEQSMGLPQFDLVAAFAIHG